MKELYSSLSSGLGKYIQSWLLPSVIATGFFSAALLPSVKEKAPWSGIFQMTPTERALVFAFSAVILSFILASTARELTRLLEGYTIWPPSLKLTWTKKQQKNRTDLQSKIVESKLPTDRARLREKLNQYPRKANLVLPTRLGNALRAGESYGSVQYGLSTVDMWTRLTAVADDKINNQLVESRAVLNFYIALIWLSLALCFATVVVTVWAGDVLLLLWLVPLLALIPLWYRRSVATVSWYSQGMQALVDLTRGKLAEALGIQLPGDLKEERKIWKAVSDYAAWGPRWTNSADWIKVINQATVQRGATDQSSQLMAAQLTPGQPIPVQLTPPGQPAPAQPTPGRPAPTQPTSTQPAPEQLLPEQPASEQPPPEQPAPERLISEQPTPRQPASQEVHTGLGDAGA